MTTIPRHVIVDLLPLYLAGELGTDTQRLVDDYLRSDPDLAARVKAAGDDLAPRPPAHTATVDPEITTMRRTRSMLALQRWLFGLAIGFTAVGLSLTASIGSGHVQHLHLMLADFPFQLGSCLVVAGAFWLSYYQLRRRLRT